MKVYCEQIQILKQQNINRIDVVNYISHGAQRQPSEDSEDSRVDSKESNASDKKESALALYATNLNESAKKGVIDPLVGRDSEVERVIQTLSRRRKNNPLLVGESGVGKTAIAEGLAKLIVDQRVPDVISTSVVHSLDLGALLAGTKYRGDFEKRLKSVLNELKSSPNQILFIDDIWDYFMSYWQKE